MLAPVDGVKQELHDTSLKVEAKYSFKFSRSGRKFCLILYHNGSNSFLCVNATIQSKETLKKKLYLLCLGTISKDFTANNMKNRFKWLRVQFFCRL